MKQRSRKLAGAIGLLALIVAWAIGGSALYANLFGGQPWWALIMFFAVVGMLWFVPAAWLIGWMSRPD